MLTPELRQTLEALLLPRLGSNPNWDMVQAYVGPEIADEMPTTTIVKQTATWIVDQALKQKSPTMLIDIIRQVDACQAGTATSLVQLADRLKAEPLLWQTIEINQEVDWTLENDPPEIEDGRPFVDRLEFRNLLPRNGLPDTPFCTVVRGEEGVGKTYLSNFCKQMATLRKGFHVGYAAAGSGVRSLEPAITAGELAYGLRTDFTKEPRMHEDPHRHARNLVAWIASYTPTHPLPALAIFDGFDTPGVPESVHTFIEELIRNLQDDVNFQKKLRIVLLGYDTGRLEASNLRFQSCILKFVGREDINTWFRNRYPGHPDFRYEETVDLIEQKLPQSGALRMRKLCTLVHAARGGFQ